MMTRMAKKSDVGLYDCGLQSCPEPRGGVSPIGRVNPPPPLRRTAPVAIKALTLQHQSLLNITIVASLFSYPFVLILAQSWTPLGASIASKTTAQVIFSGSQHPSSDFLIFATPPMVFNDFPTPTKLNNLFKSNHLACRISSQGPFIFSLLFALGFFAFRFHSGPHLKGCWEFGKPLFLHLRFFSSSGAVPSPRFHPFRAHSCSILAPFRLEFGSFSEPFLWVSGYPYTISSIPKGLPFFNAFLFSFFGFPVPFGASFWTPWSSGSLSFFSSSVLFVFLRRSLTPISSISGSF